MAAPYVLSESDKVKISTEAAESFIDAYYNALNSAQDSVPSFYLPPNKAAGGRDLPFITYNGTILNSGEDVLKMFKNLPPESQYVHFECQSLDAQVVNPQVAGVPVTSKRDAERDLTILASVSGSFRHGQRKDGPLRGFHESFMLVPNKEEVGGKGTSKGQPGRKWLIQTQTFRIVV